MVDVFRASFCISLAWFFYVHPLRGDEEVDRGIWTRSSEGVMDVKVCSPLLDRFVIP